MKFCLRLLWESFLEVVGGNASVKSSEQASPLNYGAFFSAIKFENHCLWLLEVVSSWELLRCLNFRIILASF